MNTPTTRSLGETLATQVREGTLYERMPDAWVRCHACGHNCRIAPGGEGICKVRFNGEGVLYVPHAEEQNETINAGTSLTTASGVANIFFSAGGGDMLPFLGAWRQMPEVDSEYNKDFQREEYVTTARYGLKVYRPENLGVVLTDTDIIA